MTDHYNISEVIDSHQRSSLSSLVYAGMPAKRSVGADLDATKELFRRGSYTEVVAETDSQTFEYAASLAMIAKKEEALAALSNYNIPEAMFFSGVAHWIDGDEGSAIKFLERAAAEDSSYQIHARQLLALIRKPRLRVLGAMLWQGQCGSNVSDGMLEDTKFVYQNIGFDPGDLPARPYANIHDYYNHAFPPDFFIAREVEWYNFPPNIQELPCPLFAHTSDFDAHVQSVGNWFNLFDEVIVCNHFSRNFLAPMLSPPVCTYPKSYSVAPFFHDSALNSNRDIDLYISGNTLMPYHPDKAVMLHQLLDIPENEANIVMESYTSSERYRELMSRSKASIIYVRDYGGMPTRALEALSMGCAVAIQRGCVLSLFMGEEEGVLSYSAEAGDARDVLRRILDDWPNFEKRAQRGREIVKREFSRARIASQYLRFLTVLAAKPRPARPILPIRDIRQKRPFFLLGLPCPPNHYNEMLEKSEVLLEDRLRRDGLACHVIELARDRVLRYAEQFILSSRDQNSSPPLRKDLDRAIQVYRIGLEFFPRSLVNRFNFIRCLLHFGSRVEVDEALALAETTVLEPHDSWEVDPRDDVFTYDFFSNMFNYRSYFELIVRNRRDPSLPSDSYSALILASIHYYLSFYKFGFENCDCAVSLDPEFPIYKYRLALKLAERGENNDTQQAGELLLALSKNSLVFEDAFELLERLVDEKKFRHPDFTSAKARHVLALKRIGPRKSPADLVSPLHLQSASDRAGEK